MELNSRYIRDGEQSYTEDDLSFEFLNTIHFPYIKSEVIWVKLEYRKNVKE